MDKKLGGGKKLLRGPFKLSDDDNNVRAKLTSKDVSEIYRLHSIGFKISTLAKKYKLNPQTIKFIISLKRPKTINKINALRGKR